MENQLHRYEFENLLGNCRGRQIDEIEMIESGNCAIGILL
jgi:hypothetical protein